MFIYVIGQEAPARFADPEVRSCTWQLDGGRDVRVHRYGASDQARDHGEVILEKAEATPGQIVHARAQKLRKADPALSEDAAIARVFREDKDLYWAYQHSVAHPGVPYAGPVAKEARTPETVYEEAERLMAQEEGLTKRMALQRLLLAHQGERVYHEAWRAYQLGEGVFAGTTAGEAAAPVEKTWTGYAPMWG